MKRNRVTHVVLPRQDVQAVCPGMSEVFSGENFLLYAVDKAGWDAQK
jgi:hypothetical protein